MAAFSTLALLALAGTSAAISAVNQKKTANAQAAAAEKSGEAQQAAAESSAQMDEFNAAIADQQAQDAVSRGQQDEDRFRQHIKLVIGSQRAGFAAGNVDVGFGSSVDTQADASYLGELDALTIRTNAGRQAWGYQVSATDYRNRAAVARKTGAFALEAGQATADAERTAGTLGAVSTIVGTGASLLEARYGFGSRR